MDEQHVTIIESPPPTEAHRLYRSRTDRQVAGVCGGLGEYLGFDPTLIRIAWLVSIIFAGAGLFAYLVAAVIIPEDAGYEQPGLFAAEDDTPCDSGYCFL